MKRIVITLAALFCVVAANAEVSSALKVKTYVLDNGLTVWINEDPNQHAVYGATVVRAGAVDCPGTGIAHYFEHMMFKGTDKMNTIDYAAEKPYLDSIAVKYDELALADNDSLRRSIQMEINRLSVKAADYAIPNEFDNLIAEAGGSGLNAYTSYDETVYHNKFLPEYFAQWAELNSERIMNPVFRLFQSELETVYEEKNRSDDNMISDFQSKIFLTMFAGTGYQEDVLGTTENLKNPRLSQMAEFFDKYYVASNMGLILTGNIKAEEALPIIRKTFGRIRKGEVIERPAQVPEAIEGHKNVEAMMNIPLVRVGALCYNGVAGTEEDNLGLELLSNLFNNESNTGLFDKLTVNHKVMSASFSNFSFKRAGGIMVLYLPKLVFQSEAKAVAHIQGAIDDVKNGNFSDEFFESCKLSFKKDRLQETEKLDYRIYSMATAMSYEEDWNAKLEEGGKIDAMTKDYIVELANKYLTDNYIHIHKKKGIAPKDNLQKPGYENVVPKNKDNASAYALKLRKELSRIKLEPQAIDYENGVQKAEVNPLVKVYAAGNPYNDIFNLTISYGVGSREKPELERVSQYVGLLGTADKSYEQIHDDLQTLGASIWYSTGKNSFSINISGFDENFEETLAIAADMMKNVKGDKKKLNSCKSDEKSGKIMSRGDMGEMLDALKSYVLYGGNSPFIADMGDYSDKVLLGAFADLQKVECTLEYSGALSAAEVGAAFDKAFDASNVSVASSGVIDFQPAELGSPAVFFVNKKDAAQCQFFGLVMSDKLDNFYDRYFCNLYSGYLGGGMSSLLFQEIREFRSMAYSTYGYFNKPAFCNSASVPAHFDTFVGTQCDKTIEAMQIVDSLVTKTPFQAGRLELARKEMVSNRCNAMPDFRDLPSYIAEDIRDGIFADPVEEFKKVIRDGSAENLEAFWQKHLANRPIVWCMVGNEKNVDMDALQAYGPITKVDVKGIIK